MSRAPKRRYLTKTQRNVLRCFDQNNGRARVFVGTRWSTYSPGQAHIFGQGMHSLLHQGWITSKGENQKACYSWTAEGREVYRRGWYIDIFRPPHWQREPADPAPVE